MKKTITFFLLFLLPVLAGCNAMHGLGQDIQKGGESLERAAERNM